MDKRLTLTPKEVAEELRISLPVVYQLCNRADFPAIRVGRAIRIPRVGLESWLELQVQDKGVACGKKESHLC